MPQERWRRLSDWKMRARRRMGLQCEGSCRICSMSWGTSRVCCDGRGGYVDFVSALSVFLQSDLPEIASRAIIRKFLSGMASQG